MINKIYFQQCERYQSTNKSLKLVKYFKHRVNSNRFLFLQETHATVKGEIKWRNYFKGEFFSRTVNLYLAVF